MDELNRRGKAFVDEWCEEKHTTTRRIPNQHYLLEEKQLLQPLPNLKQRDVVDVALIEFFRRYGYQREVDKLLQKK